MTLRSPIHLFRLFHPSRPSQGPRLLFILLAMLAPPLLAQNELSLGELSPGQIVLNLNISDHEQVDQDTLNASLQYVSQGRDRKALQHEVNEVIQKAIDELNANPALEFSTTFYQVNIVQTGRPTRTDIENPVFRAQQGIHVHSTDSALLLETLGKLQEEGLTLNGLYYTLSDEKREEVAARLLQSALRNLQGRAQDAAETLGKKQAELVEVTMDATPGFPQPMMRTASMAYASDAAAEFAAPVAEPGESVVSVNVSARAVLSP